MTVFHHAPCRGHIDVFHKEYATMEDVARAIAVCRGCPYIDACAKLGRDEKYGVWGGTTARQRGFTKNGSRSASVRSSSK